MERRPLLGTAALAGNGRNGRKMEYGVNVARLLDATAEELIRCYTSVPSARASASSMSTPR
jgi:hypothetical protein